MGEFGRVSNEEWAGRYRTVAKWLRRRRASRRVILSIFRSWHEWASENVELLRGLNPDQIIERADEATKRELIEIVESIGDYIDGHRDEWRVSYQRKVYSTIRGFFKVNWVNLPENGEIRRSLESRIRRAPELLTLQHLRTICIKSSQMYRAIFMCMFAGAMGVKELLTWSDQGMESYERGLVEVGGERVLVVEFEKRKNNNKEYYTLIGGDALTELEKWIKIREKRREAAIAAGESFPDALFVTNKNTPLKYDGTLRTYWIRKLRQLGIIDAEPLKGKGQRYGYHIHQIRDLFSTQLSGRIERNVREFLMGHTIDPYGYDRFYEDRTRVIVPYLKALPYLNILTSSLPFGKVDETALIEQGRKIQELKEAIKALTERNRQLERDLSRLQEEVELRTPAYRTAQRMIEYERALKRMIEGKEPWPSITDEEPPQGGSSARARGKNREGSREPDYLRALGR